MLFTIHKIISYGAAALWFILSALTMGTFLFRLIFLNVNVVIGTLFALIGCVFLWRAHTFRRFYTTLPDSIQADKSSTNFLLAETVLLLGTLLFVGILLSGAIHRVFGEGEPVFG